MHRKNESTPWRCAFCFTVFCLMSAIRRLVLRVVTRVVVGAQRVRIHGVGVDVRLHAAHELEDFLVVRNIPNGEVVGTGTVGGAVAAAADDVYIPAAGHTVDHAARHADVGDLREGLEDNLLREDAAAEINTAVRDGILDVALPQKREDHTAQIDPDRHHVDQQKDAQEALKKAPHLARGHLANHRVEEQVKCCPDESDEQKRVENTLKHEAGRLGLTSPAGILAVEIRIEIGHGNTSQILCTQSQYSRVSGKRQIHLTRTRETGIASEHVGK